VLAQALADKIEGGSQRRIAKGPTAFAWEGRDDGCSEGLFRVGDLGLGLGQSRRQAPTLVLERCMAGLQIQHLKTDCPGF
jgi:hypothetical protein